MAFQVEQDGTVVDALTGEPCGMLEMRGAQVWGVFLVTLNTKRPGARRRCGLGRLGSSAPEKWSFRPVAKTVTIPDE